MEFQFVYFPRNNTMFYTLQKNRQQGQLAYGTITHQQLSMNLRTRRHGGSKLPSSIESLPLRTHLEQDWSGVEPSAPMKCSKSGKCGVFVRNVHHNEPAYQGGMIFEIKKIGHSASSAELFKDPQIHMFSLKCCLLTLAQDLSKF